MGLSMCAVSGTIAVRSEVCVVTSLLGRLLSSPKFPVTSTRHGLSGYHGGKMLSGPFPAIDEHSMDV